MLPGRSEEVCNDESFERLKKKKKKEREAWERHRPWKAQEGTERKLRKQRKEKDRDRKLLALTIVQGTERGIKRGKKKCKSGAGTKKREYKAKDLSTDQCRKC